MHCSRVEDAVQAFVELGTLIIEGRLPAEKTDRGYKEGPHCSSYPNQTTHNCNPNDFLCKRAERLRKHMTLLATSTSHMCVEVLLCPTCQCGTERATNPEFANVPSASDLLLEQWNVSIAHNRELCNMSGRGLFQAVRSQLHFSQLSAWWSSSKGSSPTNVCYRVTMYHQSFASRFSKPPNHHTFPSAVVSCNTQLKVTVSTLPRCEKMPVVKCEACTPATSVRKRSTGIEQQPLLGESLLDPPGPPPHGSFNTSNWFHGVPPSPPRRRPSRQAVPRRDQVSHLPIVALPGPVDDRMQTTCNQRGKHDCRCEDDVEEFQSKRQKQCEATTNKINLDMNQKKLEDVITVFRVGTPDSVHISSQTDKVAGKGDLLLSAILRTSQNRVPQKPTKDQNAQQSSHLQCCSSIKKSDLQSGVSSSDSKIHPLYIKPSLHCEMKTNNNLIEFKSPVKHPITLNSSLCSSSDTEKELKLQPSFIISDRVEKILEAESLLPSKVLTSGFNPLSCSERTTSCDKKSEDSLEGIVEGLKNITIKDRSQISTLSRCTARTDLNVNCPPEPELPALTTSSDDSIQTSLRKEVPSAHAKAKFRRSLDSAASMFHWHTGLPLTSSPAPHRRASHRFDFDSSLNSVKAIRSALFDGEATDDIGGEENKSLQLDVPLAAVHCQSPGSALLGSFEESVLNGRLEPVSTVHGFTADLGASGSFCPPHLVLPVTVFFYTLGDIDKVSSPYLAHINLGKKGYLVPRVGTIQVTLLNPLGTVIKMFVIVYNLTDMPNSSHTFLRQRTLYMPNGVSQPVDNSQKYLRYLIHLRFATSKSGRVSLHTDIRMIIFRKSDMDTAAGHCADMSLELCSFTYGPTNPKFSPRK